MFWLRGTGNVEEILILLVEQHLLPGQLKAVFQLMCSFSFSSSCLSPLPSHMCITFFLILAGFARGTSEYGNGASSCGMELLAILLMIIARVAR